MKGLLLCTLKTYMEVMNTVFWLVLSRFVCFVFLLAVTQTYFEPSKNLSIPHKDLFDLF